MNTPDRKREPDITRQKILEAAYEEIHRCGFQAASMNDILRKAGVTKGALYHHFSGKKDLGYAVLEEIIGVRLYEQWMMPVEQQPEEDG